MSTPWAPAMLRYRSPPAANSLVKCRGDRRFHPDGTSPCPSTGAKPALHQPRSLASVAMVEVCSGLECWATGGWREWRFAWRGPSKEGLGIPAGARGVWVWSKVASTISRNYGVQLALRNSLRSLALGFQLCPRVHPIVANKVSVFVPPSREAACCGSGEGSGCVAW